jgi:hypothetical protein
MSPMVPTQTSPVPGPDGTYTVFAHLNADKASLYRDILGTFVAERARFALVRSEHIGNGLYRRNILQSMCPKAHSGHQGIATMSCDLRLPNANATRHCTLPY